MINGQSLVDLGLPIWTSIWGTRVDQLPLSQGDGHRILCYLAILKMGIQTPTIGLMNIPYYMKKPWESIDPCTFEETWTLWYMSQQAATNWKNTVKKVAGPLGNERMKLIFFHDLISGWRFPGFLRASQENEGVIFCWLIRRIWPMKIRSHFSHEKKTTTQNKRDDWL